jgi:hypothetical protein
MEANTFGLTELNLMETKKIEGGVVPQIDWCGVNRWAADVARGNDDGGSAWHLDQWYKQNCNGIN